MKHLAAAVLLFGMGSISAVPAIAEVLAYPDQENPSFIIDHPSDWEMVPGEQVGDYVTLNGPSGVVLQLRTIPGEESAMDEAIDASIEYLKDTFSNVKMEDPKQISANGTEALLMRGTGVDGEKQEVGFANYYIALSDGNIAEIWFAVVKGDAEGQAAAAKILNSFRMP